MMANKSGQALAPGSVIGILGGGQLGSMLSQEAQRLGFQTLIYAPEKRSPAFDVATDHLCADYEDYEALKTFGERSDVVTFEFENVPVSAVDRLSGLTEIFPSARSLRETQDRLTEKTFVRGLDIPLAPFAAIDSLEDLKAATQSIGLPAMLKTRRFGYDGKGQVKLESDTQVEDGFSALKGAPAVLEGFVSFEKEMSVVLARGRDGDMVTYDLCENLHDAQILRETRVPASVVGDVDQIAKEMAKKIAEALDHVGVLTVEFFYCGGTAPSPLLVNEIAPRVHNSGHWTLDACLFSQFENHIRAIAGWPLGSAQRHSDAVMTNLIGEDAKAWLQAAQSPNTAVHLYRKGEMRSGRKMGHITQISKRSAD